VTCEVGVRAYVTEASCDKPFRHLAGLSEPVLQGEPATGLEVIGRAGDDGRDRRERVRARRQRMPRLGAQGVGKTAQTVLGRAVDGPQRRADLAGETAHENDVAGLLLDQERYDGTRQQDGREEIGLEEPADHGGIGLGKEGTLAHPRVVDQQVDPAKERGSLAHPPRKGLDVGGIHGQHGCPPRPAAVAHLLQPVDPAGGKHDPGAAFGQAHGEGRADAG